MWHVLDVLGNLDLQGRGHGLLQGRAGTLGLCPDKPVPRRDAEELQEPGLHG